MASVCKLCFADKEIIGFISASKTIGNCDFCKASGSEIIDVEELLEFFRELLSNFQPTLNGNALKFLIQENCKLFSTIESASDILNYVSKAIGGPIATSEDVVDFNSDILENVNHWEVLKTKLKWENRYVTDIDYLIDLGWDGFFSNQIVLTVDTELYRARLHEESSENPYEVDKMYCPPIAKTKAGRANPQGIPFLYLSDNKETILYEVRATFLDEISVGTFFVKNDVADEVKIADFTEAETIFHPGRVNERIKATLIKDRISKDLSRPMRRYDSELDYIPTQFICEFIKVYTGAQGIKFKSSLHPIGNNLVIFDQTLMECKATEKVKISSVIIQA